ncbi:P-loop containing nucleoside triphosphate hydrolase protein [Podospora didyma]|uniref:P-loop containing nucleoside triphosphate hydrolase protein n=1 Tax=Podospora didyma TaxID=330526 RepID=A0AAE0NGF4_9PEZI|nr:P-loop containing nucleoside triphosphate hydrolase protein [Podospora didyma]
MSVDIDKTAMQQLEAEQRGLLDTIDELRGLHLHGVIDLPQLIVVGEQSTGKSSVLEAISRVQFPVHGGICTRFATELILRPSRETKVEVRIKDERLDDAFNQTTFSRDDLPGIIEKAKQRMGVGDGLDAYSEDVLQIKISGPDVPQLTLVDLPGFYRSEAENQRSEGMVVVNRLVAKFMEQKKSIILAVLSADREYVSHQVLNDAKKHDPARERTLGVITKPDRLEEGSDIERSYLRLVRNEEPTHQLALGWHVLRNRSQREANSTDAKRDEVEKTFFQSGTWSNVSAQDRGVENLRGKLSQVLLTHIKRTLPGLVNEIESHIKQRQAQLRELGDKRSSPQDMRKYLSKISASFHDLALDAVRGHYHNNHDFFGGLYPDLDATMHVDGRIKKLRALIRDSNRAFYHVLSVKGHRRRIDRVESEEEGVRAPPYLQWLLDLYYNIEDPDSVSIEDLHVELEALASENQGTEFPGSPNDRLSLRLFRDQCQPWETIANRHVELVLEFSKRFVEMLVGHVVGPDKTTTEALLRNTIDPYFEAKHSFLKDKIKELLHHFKHGYDPQPPHSDFVSRISRRRKERLVAEVASRVETDEPSTSTGRSGREHNSGMGRTDAARAAMEAAMNNDSNFGIEQIIDNMLAYYEMSISVFFDNVKNLALENCLVCDIPKILTAENVHDMDDALVVKLAAESARVTNERKELNEMLEKLGKGLKACLAYRPRESTEAFLRRIPNPVVLTPQANFGSSSRSVTPSAPTPSSTVRLVSRGPPSGNLLLNRATESAESHTIGRSDRESTATLSASTPTPSPDTRPASRGLVETTLLAPAGGLLGNTSPGGFFISHNRPSSSGGATFGGSSAGGNSVFGGGGGASTNTVSGNSSTAGSFGQTNTNKGGGGLFGALSLTTTGNSSGMGGASSGDRQPSTGPTVFALKNDKPAGKTSIFGSKTTGSSSNIFGGNGTSGKS